MNVKPSIFFANPIPTEHSIAKDTMDVIIAEAVHDADRAGVTGHRNTPFVLKRIRELSKGASVISNRSLIEANVVRGTKVALEYQKLLRESQID